MSTSIVEVTAQFNNKSAKFCTLILNSIYFKNEGCFHDLNDIKNIYTRFIKKYEIFTECSTALHNHS
jgi:hypothetical protein